MNIFEESNIGTCQLKNRLIRSATFEGACDSNGYPTDDYFKIYSDLSKGSPGFIITGFIHIDKSGVSMQPGQGGLDIPENISGFKKVTEEVHKNGSRIFAQLAHTGRQTLKGRVPEVLGVSDKKSDYFNQKPRVLTTTEVYDIAEKFAIAAINAMQAGFDGVQVHAAHGYLVHQFLLPTINNRNDEFGINSETNIGTAFLDLIIKKIRSKCGDSYPIIVKISGSDDYSKPFNQEQFIRLIKFLDTIKIDAIEISYGTMDNALNIMRGDIPVDLVLKVNPIYGGHGKIYNKIWKTIAVPVIKKKIKPYEAMYNLKYATLAKQYTKIPIIAVGGFRNMNDIEYALNTGVDYISMCRPFICEPDIVLKFKENSEYKSKCVNCNFCTIMCDSGKSTRCYKEKKVLKVNLA